MTTLHLRWHIGTSLMGENVSEYYHSYSAHLRTYSGFPNWFDTPNIYSLQTKPQVHSL